MARIASWTVLQVDLPLRRPFRHAAAERRTSEGVFVRCVMEDGTAGWGECLPRPYVTAETRDQVVALLAGQVLPRLIGRSFDTFEEVEAFLDACDGKAPADWVDPDLPQTAAWAAVDLALLDAFGRRFGRSVHSVSGGCLASIRYSGVLSAGGRLGMALSCLVYRCLGLRQVKIKVGLAHAETDMAAVRLTRRLLGPKTDLRVDANMAWTRDQAADLIPRMAELGVRSFEQPLAPHDLEGSADLVRSTGALIMADEGMTDGASLRRLVNAKACTAVSIRISKCGGLRASLRRRREALDAGLVVQVGCQVGESSLLSAAQLALLGLVSPVTYAEGCYGPYLLKADVAKPVLRFGPGGRPPRVPSGAGLGVAVDENQLARWTRSLEQVA